MTDGRKLCNVGFVRWKKVCDYAACAPERANYRGTIASKNTYKKLMVPLYWLGEWVGVGRSGGRQAVATWQP